MATGTTHELTPRARQIVAAARELLEDVGPDALSMRMLAKHVGIRAPSIYKHFVSKQALEAALISTGFEEQAALFEAALHESDEPLAAMSRAYRAYAQRHPHLYRLMYDRPLNRALLVPGTEERAASPAIQAAGGDIDLARAVWAFAHGMTILELGERFPPEADLDAAWQRGISALEHSARGASPRNKPRR
jgi:AcrR family transcriptional regulator